MVSEPLGRRLSDGSTLSARSKYLTSSYEGKTVWSSLLPSPGLSDKLFTRVDENEGVMESVYSILRKNFFEV
jgi:hypothetical protein